MVFDEQTNHKKIYLLKLKVNLSPPQVTLANFGYPVQTLWFTCSQILAILFRPFGLLAPRFWLSCLGPLVYLLPDFGYPVQALWFTCSHILATLFRPLVYLLPDFGYPVQALWFTCSHIFPILFRPFGLLAPKDLDYLAFQSFDFRAYLMKVIPETCRATKLDIYVFITITGQMSLLVN